jgi:hypothetical protein
VFGCYKLQPYLATIYTSSNSLANSQPDKSYHTGDSKALEAAYGFSHSPPDVATHVKSFPQTYCSTNLGTHEKANILPKRKSDQETYDEAIELTNIKPNASSNGKSNEQAFRSTNSTYLLEPNA